MEGIELTEAVKKEIKPYERGVHYYETDQMGIVHHSNYIRWFEEARSDFLEQIGMPYDKIEEEGILIPVLAVSCKYKSAIRYGDVVHIYLKVTYFNGVRFKASYQVIGKETGVLHASGESEHGFVNRDMIPLRMKKEYPKMYELLAAYVEEEVLDRKKTPNTRS
ncbi:MAG: acyl-CoA thioesterase [Lachnospiraceae bacterium]|nr:acyl-CoA thioesterase [Lachnospiraceae bacterium]